MRKFTLTLLAALSGLFANAQVSSIDDLVGVYDVTGTGTESVTNYYAQTNISESSYTVEISKNEDGTVGISNFFGLGYTLTGAVDIDAKTITIAPGQVETYMTFGSATDASGSVVATFDDDATITVSSFGAWYGTTNYVSEDASFTLTKSASVTKDWSVTGHMVFYNDETGEKNNPYLTQEVTLSKYTGADYDYILDFGVAEAIPTNIKFTVAEDGSITITNNTAYNDTYWYYDVNEGCKCFGLYTTGGYSYFEGDEKGGEFYAWCYGYSDYSTALGSGNAYFSWGTLDGISSIAAEKAQSGAIYDLTGRKVNSTNKAGIYIKNGKKFIVK